MRNSLMFDTPEQLTHQLETLGPVTGGDVLVFHGFDNDGEPMRQRITDVVFGYYTEIARSHLHDDGTVLVSRYLPLIVFTDGDATVEHLNEDDMRRIGWTRI